MLGAAGIGNALGALRTLGQALQQLGASSRQYSIPHPGGCTGAVRAACSEDADAVAVAEQMQGLHDAADAQQQAGKGPASPSNAGL